MPGRRRWAAVSIAARLKMVKKLDKGLSKDKNQSSSNQESQDEDPNKTPEPYVCTGNFQLDFTELCQRNKMVVIPPVVLRPKPPPPPSQAPEVGPPGKGKEKGKGAPPPPPEPEPEPELTEDGEPVEPPPKTYSVRDKFEYFKPSVQVEMENPDKPETVTELFVRGWRIDGAMMDTFRQCWPAMEKLHTIILWNAGLTGESITSLAACLPLCPNIKNLILDGNPVKEQNWCELMGDDSLIQNLSLRNCRIGDLGAEGIGRALGTARRSNNKLISLNLSCNEISDTGAEHIAAGLRMNRTLLSLSLANNQIGNHGAAKIGEALSRFPLTHEEVVERRRLLSEKGSPERNKSPPPSRRADSKDRPGSVRSSSHADKGDKSRKDKPSAKTKKEAKGGKESKEEEKTKGGKKDKEGTGKKDHSLLHKGGPGASTIGGRSSNASIAPDTGKPGGKKQDKKGGKKQGPAEAELQQADSLDLINPLLEVADYIEGRLWVAGNRVLINLNLSRNKLGEAGVSTLLKAMQYQTTLTLDSKQSGTGLMRLVMHKNLVPADHELMKKLNGIMAAKDPFYKPPATPEVEKD